MEASPWTEGMEHPRDEADRRQQMTGMATTTEPTSTEAPSAPKRSASLTPWETLTFTLTHATVSALLAVLSLRGLYHFGRLFGTAEYVINFKKRRRFAKALAHILERKPSGAQRRKWTREYFMLTRCEKLFYLIMDRLPRDTAGALLTISDEPSRRHGIPTRSRPARAKIAAASCSCSWTCESSGSGIMKIPSRNTAHSLRVI